MGFLLGDIGVGYCFVTLGDLLIEVFEFLFASELLFFLAAPRFREGGFDLFDFLLFSGEGGSGGEESGLELAERLAFFGKGRLSVFLGGEGYIEGFEALSFLEVGRLEGRAFALGGLDLGAQLGEFLASSGDVLAKGLEFSLGLFGGLAIGSRAIFEGFIGGGELLLGFVQFADESLKFGFVFGGELPSGVFRTILLLNPTDVFRILCFKWIGSSASPLGLSALTT